MHRILQSLIAGASLAVPAFASVTLSVDLVDPSDGITQPPPGVIAVDVLVDVSSDDVWTAGGLYGVTTAVGQADGVRLRYARNNEPNTPIPWFLVNPGLDNRFVSFVSKPRARDEAARYTNGAVGLAPFHSSGPLPITTADRFDAAWFASPPEGPSSPSVDGAIARIALDVSELLAQHPDAQFAAGSPSAAKGPVIFLSVVPEGTPGTTSATYDNPELVWLSWAVWYIPEPATISILPIAAVAFRRR